MSVVVVVVGIVIVNVIVVVIVTVPCPLLMILQSCHFHTGHMLRGTRCGTAHIITPAQATVPSRELLWDELCARDGEADRPQTCYPRWHGPAAVAHPFSQLRLSRDTNLESSAVLATRCASHTTTHTFLFAVSRFRCAERRWKLAFQRSGHQTSNSKGRCV